MAEREIYRGRIVDLKLVEMKLPDGRTVEREVVGHRGAVVIVALDAEDRVLMVRQHRLPTGKSLLELPAGTLEVGEEPEACARREIEEETGFACGRIERLMGFYSAPGFCTEYLHLFLATELRPQSRPGDEDEDIEVVPVPLAEAVAAATRGDYEDAKTIVGLLTVASRARSARTPTSP